MQQRPAAAFGSSARAELRPRGPPAVAVAACVLLAARVVLAVPRELATRALPQSGASAEPPLSVGRGPVRPARAAALRLSAALGQLTPVLYLERAEPSSQRPPRRAPRAPARPRSLARGSSCPPAAARPARGSRPASAPCADPARGGLHRRPGLAAPRRPSLPAQPPAAPAQNGRAGL